MTKLEILQKEAREKFNELFLGYYLEGETYKDAEKYAEGEMTKLNDLISSVYRAAIVDAKGAWPGTEKETDETHSTDCDMDASHGYVLTHKGCSAGLDERAVGWNMCRAEALKNLDELMPGV